MSGRHRLAALPPCARHILECQALDPSIEDYAVFATRDAFVERIRAKRGCQDRLLELCHRALGIT
jgi:hypothetical protein